MTSERDHLADLAKSTTKNLYGLLSPTLTPSSTPKEITRAYRTAALVVHPDKNPDDPEAAAKFHDITEAHAILTNEELRGLFDAAWAAREARRATKEGYDSRRREMVDELERGERKKGGMDDEVVKERVLAEEGRRMRMELETKWRIEREEREKLERVAAISETSRAIRVRWDVAVRGIDDVTLMDRFRHWGKVDGVTIRDGERKVRFGDEKHRRVVKTGLVVFETIEDADKAIKGFEARKKKTEWRDFLVEWAEGKEPEGLVRNEKLSHDEMETFLRDEEDVLSRMISYQREKDGKMDTT
jgi:DnaJ family protein C protein 17